LTASENEGLVSLEEASKAKAIDDIGGPGRTRTCNQTVMSGDGSSENRDNIDE
jgi:hypothetical protein